ncbi:hypothetical protein ASG73_13515 [Janibacter sp. Soil728]|uniref:L,D-transpeptidase family protein n=1 Tax=Janibacter sp. Soil728 TaxID=1736393 RepID=UPI000700F91F|nr:peptidoglycan-binding protein [Janibacter sp. Soil728]KRE35726.1 hypothetical protein ASG73_13515 [Janibacter sp. Soil728]
MSTYEARHAMLDVEPSPHRRLLMRGGLAAASVTAVTGAGFFVPAAAATRRTIKLGDRGLVVAGLQRRLTAGGYSPGPADGIFGRQTHTAVVKLQGDHHLVKDGVVGPRTWDVVIGLSGSTPPPDPEPTDPEPADPPASSHPLLKPGSKGAAVKELQIKLRANGYWHSGSDGEYGDTTMQAVMTVQKNYGMTRDGVCGPVTWARIDRLTRPRCRTTSGNAIEVDLTRQVLRLVLNGRTAWVFNTSTGSGKRYYQGGRWHTATTPTGRYRFFRRVNGMDYGPLGALYRPVYFNGGIAVHGYSSVPAYPASHGCCRVSNAAMNAIWANNWMPNNRLVWVY